MSAARDIAGLLDAGPVLLDGAIGSQLLTSGFDLEFDFRGLENCCEVLNLTRPEQVLAVHESYLDAGARVITTNTFLGSPLMLRERGLEGDGPEIHAAAVRAARTAIDAWTTPNDPAFVLGSMGPLQPDERGAYPDASAIRDSYATQANWLAGADGLLLETATDIDVLALALEAVRGVASSKPLLASIYVDSDGAQEASLDRLAELGRAHNLMLLGVNCTLGPLPARATLEALRERWSGALGLWANAGEASGTGLTMNWPVGASEFAAASAALTHEFDLALVGGCCGTGPAHIRALAEELNLAPTTGDSTDDS